MPSYWFSQALNAMWLFLIFAFGLRILRFGLQSDGSIGEKETDGEKEESDAKALRRMVKNERRMRKKAEGELEKERTAAATAAEEAMAMILRLQREKSGIEMQANQDRRMAEQRQQHDQQVIGYLERMAMEYERRSSEKKVEMGGEEGEDDLEKSFSNSTMEDL